LPEEQGQGAQAPAELRGEKVVRVGLVSTSVVRFLSLSASGFRSKQGEFQSIATALILIGHAFLASSRRASDEPRISDILGLS
jgi:hypothetical protein